jgi:hypothetical protein
MGSKHKSKLGANLNESVASGVNQFARAQLEKLGWKEGDGLGKERKGMATHIRVTKRIDEQGGLGATSSNIDPVVTTDQWWKSSVGNTLAKLAATKKSKKDKKKKDKKRTHKDDTSSTNSKRIYTDEELFQATGGVRFGMRAQTQQKSKWKRAESNDTDTSDKIEWDGLSEPKIILKETITTTSSKKRKQEETTGEDDQKTKPEEKEPATVTSSGSSDENDNDNDEHQQQPEKKKRKKEKTKEKKSKKNKKDKKDKKKQKTKQSKE